MPAARAFVLWVVALSVPSLVPLPAAAQFLVEPYSLPLSSTVTFDEADSSFPRHIERARALLADRQWDEALETLLRAQSTYGEKLVRLPGEARQFTRAVSAREFVHLELVGLAFSAPEALARYRQRVDALAETWYRQGVAERNAALLERVVQQQFASSWGDECLWAAGELALERGDFTAARALWEQLAPCWRWPERAGELGGRPGLSLWQALQGVALDTHWPQLAAVLQRKELDAGVLAYPDTNLNLAEIGARLALVSALEGDLPRARLERDLLVRLYPKAEGLLAGKRGKFIDTLAEILQQQAAPLSPALAGEWPTFGGSFDRSGMAQADIDPAGLPEWTIEYGEPLRADGDLLGMNGPRVAEGLKELLSYHPAVADGRVFVAQAVGDRVAVRAFQLANGQPAWPRAAEGLAGEIYPAGEGSLALRLPIGRRVGVPRFTLTVHDNHLFFRGGAAATNESPENSLAGEQSQIVGLDLAAQGRMLPGFPLAVPDANWAFEGPPVCRGARLFVALRQKGNRPQLHVACYSIANGRLLWRRFVAAADSAGKGTLPEISHTLLSLSGTRVFVSTNLGAVACLAAETGELSWLTLYPRSQRPPDSGAAHWFRELSPCVLYRDQVLVAPQDSEGLFSLDAASGRLLWDCRPLDGEGELDIVHLLGVGQGHLLASGRRLWWIDLQSGRVAARFPDQAVTGAGLAGPSPEGFGRGVLVGDEVFFPTRQRIHVFWQALSEPGQCSPSRQSIGLGQRGMPGGNLVAAGQWLLVSGAEKLYALPSVAGAKAKLPAAGKALPAAPALPALNLPVSLPAAGIPKPRGSE